MKRNYPEDDLQRAVIKYIRLQYPHLLCFAVPNGGKRNPREAARLKSQGVLAGVSDILLFWPGGMGAIELKAGNRKPSGQQEYFGDRWEWCGGNFAVCNSLDGVVELLRKWGVK